MLHRDVEPAFDPSACLEIMWAAVAELGAEACPPFAARFTDNALAFFKRWSLAQASLLQHVRHIGTPSVGKSLLGEEVADKELSVAVCRENKRSLPTYSEEERVEREMGLQSGQLNVHVRSWRTPLIEVQPTSCLSATWTILYNGDALVALTMSPFLTFCTARSRSVVRSYADLAKGAYASPAGGVRVPVAPAAAGPAAAALAIAARPLKPSGFTCHSEHEQDTCILFLEQVPVFAEEPVTHPLLSLGTAKVQAYTEAALLSDVAETRTLLYERARAIALSGHCTYFARRPLVGVASLRGRGRSWLSQNAQRATSARQICLRGVFGVGEGFVRWITQVTKARFQNAQRTVCAFQNAQRTTSARTRSPMR